MTQSKQCTHSLPGRRKLCRQRRGAAFGLRTGHGLAGKEIVQRLACGCDFEGEFSDVTRSYAGKGVVR